MSCYSDCSTVIEKKWLKNRLNVLRYTAAEMYEMHVTHIYMSPILFCCFKHFIGSPKYKTETNPSYRHSGACEFHMNYHGT